MPIFKRQPPIPQNPLPLAEEIVGAANLGTGADSTNLASPPAPAPGAQSILRGPLPIVLTAILIVGVASFAAFQLSKAPDSIYRITVPIVASACGVILTLYKLSVDTTAEHAKANALARTQLEETHKQLEEHRTANLIRRATTVKEFMSMFFVQETLNSAFHDLVYAYDDKTWELVDKAYGALNPDNEDLVRPYFAPIDDLNIRRERKAPYRFYNPEFFQFSPEERRLDALLYFFNVVGLYYERKLVNLWDITALLGYQLGVMCDRRVIKHYLELSKDSKKTQQYSLGAPLSHLRRLLKDFATHREAYAKKLEGVAESTERSERNRADFVTTP